MWSPMARTGCGLLAAFVFGGGSAARLEAQQTSAVGGFVTDAATGQPLPNAQVTISGTTLGVLADNVGRYRIEGVPLGTAEVKVIRIGYAVATATVELQAGQVATADFALRVSAVALDQMVVTVTGPQRRRELGNAASIIDAAAETERSAPTSFTDLVQGKAPGVQILQSSGTVGGTASVKIRGNSSVHLSDTPLIYVDGIRYTNSMMSGPDVGGQSTSRMNDLNVDDIESIEIVKGPSAATLYGTEAAAGVMRITTKQGRGGPPQWNLRSEVGVNWNATEWPTNVWNPRSFYGESVDLSLLFAPGTVPPNTFAQIADTLYSLNLLAGSPSGDSAYAKPWRTGLEQSYGLSVRGGVGNVSYYVSGDLDDRLGGLPNNEAKQRGLRVNLNLTPSERTGIQISSSVGSLDASLPDNDNSAFGYIGVALVGFPWAMPLRRRDPVSGAEVTTCPDAVELQRALVSAGEPLPLSDLDDFCALNPFYFGRTFDDVATLVNQNKVERFNGGVTANHRPFGFLTLRGTLGYDELTEQNGQTVPVDADRPFGSDSRGFRSTSAAVLRNLTADASATAVFDLTGAIRSTTSIGGQFFRVKLESTASVGREIPPGVTTVSNAVRTEGFESVGERRTIGLYVQQQMAYRDRLFLTPAVRFDESSTFGASRPKQAYPRVMASWVLSEEGWFNGIPGGSLFSSLRLRGAWGRSGREPGPTASLQVLGARRVTFQSRDVAGVALLWPGNPDLRPERGEEVELGFDGSLFEGRVGVDFTWYRQVTRDAIVDRPIAPSTGFSIGIADNVGELRNSGLEVAVNAMVLNRGDLRWDWRLNVGTNSGMVTKLDEPIVFGSDGNSQRIQEGYPYAAYFSRTYTLSGDQVTFSDSATYVGQPTPEFEGSLSTSAEIGWLSLGATLGFAGGHQQFNATERFRCGFLGGGLYGGMCSEIFERDAEGEPTDRARIKAAAAEENSFQPWIEDADFARLRSVSARFTLPAAWAAHVGAGTANLTLVAENLALFTSYSGLDPETNFAGGDESSRAEFFTLPLAKRLVGRLSLTF